MIQMYSGEGRGKSSIAAGTALRMVGAGKSVIFAQFMKSRYSSEIAVLEQMEAVQVLRMKESFPFFKQMSQQQKQQMTEVHNRILEQIVERVQRDYGTQQPENDKLSQEEPELLVVLDEITYAYQWELIDRVRLEQFLDGLPAKVELIMTGRNPALELLKRCAYWSELTMKRHPYERGIAARKGIEY